MIRVFHAGMFSGPFSLVGGGTSVPSSKTPVAVPSANRPPTQLSLGAPSGLPVAGEPPPVVLSAGACEDS